MISNIIPSPKKVQLAEGVVELPLSVTYKYSEWADSAAALSASFEKIFERPLEIGNSGIMLEYDASLPQKAYRIDSRDGIVLSASSKEGMLYAVSSLILAINQKNDGFTLEKALIEDYPDKDYRALMVDLAREWHPAHTIHKYIDLCFILKIKYLHLHFIDDQRYTLPSKAFPNITNGNRSYSYSELEAFRHHANEKGVFIVPEFEVPGHAKALNKNYPEFFANTMEGDGGTIVSEEGVLITADNVICAGNPKTEEAIKILITEICELFPETPYIHIGGDEANIKAWNYCSVCKKYMKDNGIEDVYELYSEFVGRVARIVLDLGKTPIVWEGFPKKGVKHIPKETIVTAWESHYHMAYDLIDEGFKIINGSWQPLYIVPSLTRRWNFADILNWNVYNWQHWWQHSEANLNPINIAPTDQVIGAQFSVWECTFEQEFGRTMENLTALSERTWTVRRVLTESEFASRAKPTLIRISRFVQDT